jgi:hypothetical protein
MENLDDRLAAFTPVGLPDLERVSLLDRMDTKYVFTRAQLPEFLALIRGQYFILEINERRMFRYESLYFDTDDFELYNHHYCGRLNRYKVRFRKYVESDLSYFEIKHKNNKGRTIKRRLPLQSNFLIEGEARDFLEENSPLSSKGLQARIWVNFTRITLVSIDFKERLTLDLDLNFLSGSESRSIDNLVIAEVKQGRPGQSVFSRIMKEHHIRKGSISKYCFGVASMFSNIRVNNFKSQLLYLNRILYAAPARH